MAGSGDLSNIGWIHALNAAQGVANGITVATAGQNGPGGDLIGVSTGTLTVDTTATTITCSAGISKAIPDGAVLVIVEAAGGKNTWDMTIINNAGGYASGTTTAMTVQSFRPHITHNTSPQVYVVATNNYVALTSTTPTASAVGTEVTYTSYSRQLPVWSTTTTSTSPTSANSGTITYGPFTGGTGATASAGMLMDSPATAAVAANMLAFYVWGTAKTPGVGDSLQITSAQLSLAGS